MKVLILTSDVGGGHRSVASALAASFAEAAGDECRVEVVDFLADYAPFPLSHAREVYGFLMRYPFLYDIIYDVTNTPGGHAVDAPAVGAFLEAGMRRMLRDHSPDLIVATHPLAAPSLASLLYRRRQSLAYYTVVTDYGALHTRWAFPFGELWFAPSPETAEELTQGGVPAPRVAVSGYPVHPRFNTPGPPAPAVRAELGLEPERFTVLLVGGAEGVGPLEETVRALASAPAPWQLLVICGRNDTLREKLHAREGAWAIPVHIDGHTGDMPGRMRAADVLLTKAGAATLSEALVMGLPMLLINVLPGQEEGNAGHFVRLGAARRVESPEDARAAVAELAQPGSPALPAMRAAVRRAARPQASREVAETILARGTTVTAPPIPPLFGLHLLESRRRQHRER